MASTYLFQRRGSSHEFIGTPKGRGRIGGSTPETRLCGTLFDEIGAIVLRNARPIAHQLQGPQYQITGIDGHTGHVARKDIGVVVVFVVVNKWGEFQRVTKSNGLKQTGEIVIAIVTFAQYAKKEIEFAGTEQSQCGLVIILRTTAISSGAGRFLNGRVMAAHHPERHATADCRCGRSGPRPEPTSRGMKRLHERRRH